MLNNLDEIEELLMVDATNIDGSALLSLLDEYSSVNLLDLTGDWTSLDPETRAALNGWDQIADNTLITAAVPEPSTLIMLLALVGAAFLWRRRVRFSSFWVT